MRPPRTALPLPRYVLRKPLKSGGWAYFFNVPAAWVKAGCLVQREALGTDYDAAIARVEKVLLPALDAWRIGNKPMPPDMPAIEVPGTLDWVFAEYRADRRFTKLDAKTRRNRVKALKLVSAGCLLFGVLGSSLTGQRPLGVLCAVLAVVVLLS